MKAITWRNAALVLAAVCGYQQWHGCRRATHAATKQAATEHRLEQCLATSLGSSDAPIAIATAKGDRPSLPALDALPVNLHGFKVPGWVAHLAPQPGENLRDYRDRIVPLAQMAIAPQRSRVARTRDDFAHLDPRQLGELDGAVKETATAIQDRVMNGILSGELRPGTFKPMTGVTLARDVLDLVERGNTRFQNSLTPDQQARLASHRFDFADYLLFSAHWEDALHVLD
jgi:hypothetical protein